MVRLLTKHKRIRVEQQESRRRTLVLRMLFLPVVAFVCCAVFFYDEIQPLLQSSSELAAKIGFNKINVASNTTPGVPETPAPTTPAPVVTTPVPTDAAVLVLTPTLGQNPDGCGHHDWRKKPNGKLPVYSSLNEQDFNWLNRVDKCVRQYALSTIKYLQRKSPMTPEDIQTLQCNALADFNATRDVLLNYDTVWFLGDSIHGQQFFTLLCMLNPEINAKEDMEHYRIVDSGSPDDPLHGKYAYAHGTTNKTTTFIYSRFGWKWDHAERNLYNPGMAFDKAIHNLTQKGAIVLDANAHYDGERWPQLEKALTHIGNQAQQSNASVFYMEPHTEEWPTSNGMWIPIAGCQKINPEQLDGHYDWLHKNSNETARIMQSRTLKAAPSLALLDKYKLVVTHHTRMSHNYSSIIHPHYDHVSAHCQPDCLPADWRRTVAHTILDNTTVSIVPIFWQQYFFSRGTFVANQDCTHKSLEGIVNMNQQLVRTMAERQASYPARIEG